MNQLRLFAVAALTAGALAALPALAQADLHIEGNAKAAQFEASSYPLYFAGGHDPYGAYGGGITNVLTTGNGYSVDCTKVTYSSVYQYNSATDHLTAYPSFSGCTFGAGGSRVGATIETGVCGYEYSALKEAEINGADAFSAVGKVACLPFGLQEIQITLPSLGCTLTMTNQTLSGGTVAADNYTDPSTEDQTVLALEEGKNVAYSTSGFSCQFLGIPAGNYTDGSLHLGMQLWEV